MDSRLCASNQWGDIRVDKRYLYFFKKLCTSTENKVIFDFSYLSKGTYNFKVFGGTPKLFVLGLSKVVYVHFDDYLTKITDKDLNLFKALGRHHGCLKRVQLVEKNPYKEIATLMPLMTLIAHMAPVKVGAFSRIKRTASSFVENKYFSPSESELFHLHVLLKKKEHQFGLDLNVAEMLKVDEKHRRYHRILATASMRSKEEINRYAKRFSVPRKYKKYFQHLISVACTNSFFIS